MKKTLLIMTCLSFMPILAICADSASNRKDQTLRIGLKTGFHWAYAAAGPLVVDLPGENWTLGAGIGSGKYVITTTFEYSDGSKSESSYEIGVDVTELNFRYYIGNSFNIPFGYSMFTFKRPDWIQSGATYDLEVTINQFNLGIGNEWTYDWGGFLGIDWVQTGSQMSSKATVTHKSGTETTTSKTLAEEVAKDTRGLNGLFIITFGFGF